MSVPAAALRSVLRSPESDLMTLPPRCPARREPTSVLRSRAASAIQNLEQNQQCILTTGSNNLDGLDLVVEGEAAKVSEEPELRTVADTYESKYGARLTAPEGTWFGLGDAIRNGEVPVYRVAPSTAWGFGKGSVFSQTRWAFS